MARPGLERHATDARPLPDRDNLPFSRAPGDRFRAAASRLTFRRMNLPGFDVPEMSPLEVKERLDNEHPLVLVDVREPHEYAIADLAQYAPARVPVGQLLERMSELDPTDNLVIYCRSGSRSAWAVQQLMAAGYEKVFNLEGGILKWRLDVDPSLRAY